MSSHIPVEAECGIVGVAEQPLEVGVLDGEHAARTDRIPHLAQQVDRPGKMLKQEAAVHEVVSARALPLIDVT